MPTQKILILCAGLGMGNASRVAAVIESLIEQYLKNRHHLEITIFSWGAGYAFLDQFKSSQRIQFDLRELNTYTNTSFIDFIRSYIANSLQLKQEIKKINPHLLLLDSDYHFLAYLLYKAPKFYIAQTFDVLKRAKKINYSGNSLKEKVNFIFREKLDLFYQRRFSSLVFVPTFSQDESKGKKDRIFLNIPLIVRREFLLQDSLIQENDSTAVLLSGSQIEKAKFLQLRDKYNIDVFSPATDNPSFLLEAERLNRFAIVFTQGGMSSLSEAIALKKVVVAFPISNHPEQILNCIEIERLGLGMVANLSELDDFPSLQNRIKKRDLAANKVLVRSDGADIISTFIFNYMVQKC